MLKKKFNKNYVIQNLSHKTGFSVNFSKKIINDLIEIIIRNIKQGNFQLINIGSFKIIQKGERVGRNPKTLQEFKISSRKTISFTSSKKISNNLKKIYE